MVDHRLRRRKDLFRECGKFTGNCGALFLDRDGVIIQDMHYLKDENKVLLHERIKELLGLALRFDVPVFVITNQSGIARKRFDWEDYRKVTSKMMTLLGSHSEAIYAIYANGYSDCEQENSWRKPNPEMIINAAIDYNIDLESSVLIGDRISDIIAGARANVGTTVHLLTGHGAKERSMVDSRKSNANKFLGEKNTPDLITAIDLSDCLSKLEAVISKCKNGRNDGH